MSRAPDWDSIPRADGAGSIIVWRHPATNMRWVALDPTLLSRATAHAIVVLLTFEWLTVLREGELTLT